MPPRMKKIRIRLSGPVPPAEVGCVFPPPAG
ncbi:hypothetical protein FHS29_005799 [Saccharothrix tamanrassetensis]|uniref:Uncharacterized protein n=1 Tax=Saccharothrix tamanrassetensis TaxID=1051531 RepID=A0A841CPF2_9PSEU|nr:hypothetical protein [Saccharothrix tamanrassetensis]